MKGIIVDESVKIYSEPSNQNISLATLKKGDEVELGKVSKKKREVWVAVTLSSGLTGYIPGETKIFVIKKVQLLKDQVELHEGADAESGIIKTYPKNTVLTAVGVEGESSKGWVKVIDAENVTGFISGEARIKLFEEATKAGGKKAMLTGGMFAILGAAFYIFSISQSANSSNMGFLIVAIVAFGLIQFVQGYIQYSKAKKNEKGAK